MSLWPEKIITIIRSDSKQEKEAETPMRKELVNNQFL